MDIKTLNYVICLSAF